MTYAKTRVLYGSEAKLPHRPFRRSPSNYLITGAISMVLVHVNTRGINISHNQVERRNNGGGPVVIR